MMNAPTEPPRDLLDHFSAYHGAEMTRAIGETPFRLAKLAAYVADPCEEDFYNLVRSAMEQAFLSGAMAEKSNPCPL